jgi:hypothetical protein
VRPQTRCQTCALERALRFGRPWRLAAALSVLLIAGLAPPAAAHGGQPYPLIEKVEAGPYQLDLWGDPDFGDAEFWVLVDGAVAADSLAVRLLAFPESDPAHEIEATADWQPTSGQPESARFVAEGLPFDRDGWWAVTLQVEGPEGQGKARTRVEVRSLGPSGREALYYLIPFVFLAIIARAHRLRLRRFRELAAGRPEGAKSKGLQESGIA